MKQICTNINIVGGGLIGLFTAYTLSKFGLSITILEKKSAVNFKKNTIDQRTIAISEGTKNFLEKIDIWRDLKPFVQQIKTIKVIDRKIQNQLEFDNQRRKSNLGYIVKNSDVIKLLYNKINKRKNVKIINNVKITNFENTTEKIITNLDDLQIITDLNIAADGKNSFVKQAFKTPYFFKDYKKKAFVIILTHSKNHFGTAFEFFYKNGPLAILPMKKKNGKFMSSIVWTNESNYLLNLKNMDVEKLKSILLQETQNCIGNITGIISKQLFPLTAHINTKFFERRTVYIGDAAHSFHPIAGQGWNLGMSDIENLSNLVNKYLSCGISLGDSSFCKQFNNDNFYNAYRLYQITDKLDNIFRIQNPIFKFSRLSGINFIQKNKKIKNIISDFAMGIN